MIDAHQRSENNEKENLKKSLQTNIGRIFRTLTFFSWRGQCIVTFCTCSSLINSRADLICSVSYHGDVPQ